MLTNKTFQQLLNLSDSFSILSLGNLNGNDTYLLSSDDCSIEDVEFIVKGNTITIKLESNFDNELD